MRLPRDPENWTGVHVERAIAEAQRLYDRYEALVDFDNRAKTDDLYRSYQLAREQAIEVACYVNYLRREAKMLP
jgi:hypothetical protein